MKTLTRLLSFLLSAQIFVFALSAAAFATKEDLFSANTVVPGMYGSIAGPEEGYSGNEGISLMSLLPMDEENDEVFIDRSTGIPDGLDNDSFYVKEAFSRNLTLGTSGEYEKLLFSSDDNNYRSVSMDDVISFDSISYSSTTHSEYGQVKYGYAYFIVGYTADDQLDNTSTTKYKVKVYYKSFSSAFLNNTDYKLINESGTEIKTYQNEISEYSYSNEYYIENQILPDALGKNEYPKLKLVLPAGYSSSNTAIYEGLIKDEAGLSSASNITSDVLGNGYKLNGYKYDNVFSSNLKFTVVISKADGNKFFIPVNYWISTAKTYVSLSKTPDTNKKYDYLEVYFNDSEYYNYLPVYEAESFTALNINIGARFWYFSEPLDKYILDSSRVFTACIGFYETWEDMLDSGVSDIKDYLFTDDYSSNYPIDFSKCSDLTGHLEDGTEVKVKVLYVTTVDEDGFIYHNALYVGIVDQFPESETEQEPILSDDTYFNVYGPNKTLPNENGYARSYSYYKVTSGNDSYYRNGFQTVLILDNNDPVPNGTTIYPEFSSLDGTKIFTSEGLQKSEYSPLTFESGKAVQYSASAENGVNLKNYWVTYVTRQSGPKLFVNATNAENLKSENGNPRREVLLNNSYGFYHDIFFANIGDEELTGINVSLSPDTTGVKLDPYWTVIDTSVKKLNPFTTTRSYAIDNIAKIRLIPEDETEFSPISGTLTISTNNGGSVDIDLTGIAGVPKIVTDKLYDGVKYVPYSHVIMTNSMYDTDAMTFSITSGTLPVGISLKPNGELYGIPLEEGEFTFTVEAKYKGNAVLNSADSSDSHTYTLTVKNNSDDNVDAVNEDSQGYSLQERISKYITVYYNGFNAQNDLPRIDRIELDSDLFWSEGSYSNEFIAFYIDGYELTEGVDYYAEEGSTRITIRSQTFSHVGMSGSDVPHTLACEFRTENKTDELKRSAQNVYLNYVNIENNNEENNGGNNGENSGGNNSGNNGGSSGGTIAPVITNKKNESVVSASFTVIDADGNPIPDLLLELHSTPQYARTDSNGSAKFDSVEFGKHTLYILNLETGKKVSKSFTIESGSAVEIKNNIITTKENAPVIVTIRFNGDEIELLSGSIDNIEAGAGMRSISKSINNSQSSIWLISVPAIAAIASILIVKKRRDITKKHKR